MDFGLKKDIIDRINVVFISVNEVEQVIFYGSRAMGTHRNGSDIDLTMVGNGLNLSVIPTKNHIE